MSKKAFSTVLWNQFEQSFDMLEQAITTVSLDDWTQGDGEWFFSFRIYHIIETIDFYTLDSPKLMEWGARAGFDWNTTDSIEIDIIPLITRKLIENYLSEMIAKLKKYLLRYDDSHLLQNDEFTWFVNIFEKMIYLLRHTVYHIGELHKALRDFGGVRAIWQ